MARKTLNRYSLNISKNNQNIGQKRLITFFSHSNENDLIILIFRFFVDTSVKKQFCNLFNSNNIYIRLHPSLEVNNAKKKSR